MKTLIERKVIITVLAATLAAMTTAAAAPTAAIATASSATSNAAIEAPAEIIDADALAGATAPAEEREVAVRGRIAGVVEGTSWSEDCSFAPPFDIASNLILAPVGEGTPHDLYGASGTPDPAVCLPVALPDGEIRAALSPAVNPDAYGREVVIYGVNTEYYGVSGIREVTGYSYIGGGGGDDDPPAPDPLRGSREAPLDVATFRSVFEPEVSVDDCWLTGVIVGYVASTGADSAVFGHSGEGAAAGNLLVADVDDADDATDDGSAVASGVAPEIEKCVAVQLPKGSVREALNLADNPANLGCRIVAHGVREIYCDLPGLKHTDLFTLERKDPDGVAMRPEAAAGATRYYRPDGTQADPIRMRAGLYIAVAPDGTARKVMVK